MSPDHEQEARRHLESALAKGADEPMVEATAATVHALLHLSDTVKHGLRDLLYELRS